MPIMAQRCSTCPFNPDGDQELRSKIMQRVVTEASQTCHSTGVMHGRPDTHLCRGARDFQLEYLHRIGFLAEPTDACWAAKWQEIQHGHTH